MHNVSSSYFDAASLTVALLAASSLHRLGGWGHGLADVVWHGGWSRAWLAGVVWHGGWSRAWLAGLELHHEQLQLASSGNQFSKIGHI